MRVVSALFAALALTGAASASTTIEITYSQRDLVDPARVEALQLRIERAAERVCNVRQARSLQARAVAMECAREAEERANAQLARAIAAAGTVTVAAR